PLIGRSSIFDKRQQKDPVIKITEPKPEYKEKTFTINRMMAEKDYSWMQTRLYKMIRKPNGEPLQIEPKYKGKTNTITLYKPVNPLGDGYRGREYYKDPTKQSVINNGGVKVKVMPDIFYFNAVEKHEELNTTATTQQLEQTSESIQSNGTITNNSVTESIKDTKGNTDIPGCV